MFWETCAKHSFEIITALLVAGIIGYLWSRWSGGGTPKVDNSAYENQIRSLRDRIKQQDIDLQASAGLRDSWTSEKEGLNKKINELASNIDQTKLAFAGYISPDVHDNIQTRATLDLNEATNKHDMLIAEREGLLNTIKGLETRVTQASALQSSVASAEAKIKDLENKLREASVNIGTNETQLAEKQKHDDALLQAKDSELNELKYKLQQAYTKSTDLESQLLKLKDALAERDQAAQDAETKAKELDKHYNGLIAVKDEEIKTKISQVSSQGDAILSQFTQKDDEIREAQNKNQQLLSEITQLLASIDKSKENELVSVGKINELQARLHQTDQESSTTKAEINTLKSKLSDLEKTNLALQESEKKMKEWEGRWKQASTEAEHYKLAHEQTTKERDEMKEWEARWKQASEEAEHYKLAHEQAVKERDDTNDHILRLDADLISYKNQLELLQEAKLANQSELTEVINERDGIKAQVTALESSIQYAHNQFIDIQKKLEQTEAAHTEAEQKLQRMDSLATNTDETILALNKQLDEAKYFGGEWEGRFKEANDKLGSMEQLLMEAHKQTQESSTRLHQIESQLTAANDKLYLANNQLSDLSMQLEESKKALEQSHQSHQAAGEWESKYKELSSKFQSELAKAQQTIAASHAQTNEFDARYKELNNKFNSIQLLYNEAKQKVDSSAELHLLKTSEAAASYKAEAAALNKKITEIESEKLKDETLLKANHIKDVNDHKKQIVRLLDVIADLKVAAVQGPNTTVPKKLTVTPIIKTKLNTTDPKEKSLKKPSITPAPKSAEPIPISIDYKAATTVLGKKIKADDHKIIEGIGPKIEVLLKKGNIKTWALLANTPIRDIQILLDKGGNKYSLADPTSWPAQARLASMGEWAQLKKLQDNLTAGRARKNAKRPSKISKPLDLGKAQEILGTKWAMDDLKIVEGIGPKIAKLLHKANIKTWKALARSETKSLQNILDKAGSSFTLADPKTWAKQSALAASGEWSKLKSLQAKLKGGK